MITLFYPTMVSRDKSSSPSNSSRNLPPLDKEVLKAINLSIEMYLHRFVQVEKKSLML